MENPTVHSRGNFCVSTDPDRLDIPAIHADLSNSYWSPGIPIDVVQRAISGSLCFGLFNHINQIGFARVISVRAKFAFLCVVYVLED